MSEEHLMDPSRSVCLYVHHVFFFLQGWASCIIETKCCAIMRETSLLYDTTTVISNHISAMMTYAMCCEKHIWNVSILQGVHLSNLTIIDFHNLLGYRSAEIQPSAIPPAPAASCKLQGRTVPGSNRSRQVFPCGRQACEWAAWTHSSAHCLAESS